MARPDPSQEALFSAQTVGVALLDSELAYVRMNDKYAELRRAALEEQLGRHLDEAQPTLGPVLRPLLERVRAGEPLLGHVLEGSQYHMVIDVLPLSSGEFLVLAVQTLERRQAERALAVRLQFAELISELSAAFVELPAERIDEGIEEALSVAGVRLDLDRASLLQFDEKRLMLTVTHDWTAPGVPRGPALREYHVPTGHLFGRVFVEGEAIVVSSLDELPEVPEGPRLRVMLDALGVRALALVPLRVGSRLRGVVAFSQTRSERQWPSEVVATLRLASEIFANALERQRIDRELRSQLTFEQAYSRLAAQLLAVAPLELAAVLERALGTTCTALGFSRAVLFTLPGVSEAPQLFCEWHAEGVAAHADDALRGFAADTWPLSVLRSGELVMASTDELPSDADAIRRFLGSGGADLHVFVPLRVRQRTAGVVIFEAPQEPRSGRVELTSRVQLFVDLLASAISRVSAEIERQRSQEELQRVKSAIEVERDFLRHEAKGEPGKRDLLGQSPALRRALESVDAVAITNAAALLLGESGVGKELFARAVHERSRRADGPLIKVNCASIPKDLFESEFFGHVRGSFTGAIKDRVGRFELAHRGTLFLDEVGEIPLELQSKLLRVLQEGEFERVGDDRTRKVDVRIVAATNRDLAEDVSAGRFRQDLYYRLSVFPIHIPPLRERREDIPLLAEHFAELHRRSFGRPDLLLTPEHLEALTSYEWPGNVRELGHVLERAFILAGRSGALRFDIERHAPAAKQAPKSSQQVSQVATIMTDGELTELTRRSLLAALERAAWRIGGQGGAAEILGLKPSTLRDRMRALRIERPH